MVVPELPAILYVVDPPGVGNPPKRNFIVAPALKRKRKIETSTPTL